MNGDSILAWCIYGLYVPFLLMGLILVHYVLRRALWRRRKRLGKSRLGFYPSAFALGMALQFVQVYHRPSMAYVREVKREEQDDGDEDDLGEPETPAARRKHFFRQLWRIRRGDPVDKLVLRI
jgi:hypothetical protein